jgi:acetolactate synthase I/III small subunit
METTMRHVISAIVENKSGVLAHISGLFSSRGFNIDSLTVGRTENPNLSRMTIVVKGDDAILEQVRKQLDKVIDVIKVTDYAGRDIVQRDLALVKIAVTCKNRQEVVGLVDIFRGKVVDISKDDMMVELSGPSNKIEAFVEMAEVYGIKELVRTGVVGMARGEHGEFADVSV